MSKKNIIISAHCDDAILCLGGYILSSENVVVIDIFGTCAWANNEKIKNNDEITRTNQSEERKAIKKSDAELIIYELPEALMRGYSSWNQKKILKSDEIISNKIRQIIEEVSGNDNKIFFPMGIGNHVDHVLINNELKGLFDKLILKKNRIFLYEDMPYAWYGGIDEKLKDLRKNWILEPNFVELSAFLDKKISLLKLYKSQVDVKECQKVIEYSRSIKEGKILERIWEIKQKND